MAAHRRILVIDDEYAIRVLLKSFLEGHDYEVRLAEDGEHALQAFEEFQPNVVISDIESLEPEDRPPVR